MRAFKVYNTQGGRSSMGDRIVLIVAYHSLSTQQHIRHLSVSGNSSHPRPFMGGCHNFKECGKCLLLTGSCSVDALTSSLSRTQDLNCAVNSPTHD